MKDKIKCEVLEMLILCPMKSAKKSRRDIKIKGLGEPFAFDDNQTK